MAGIPLPLRQADQYLVAKVRAGYGVLVERSADGVVVCIADAALGHRGPLFGLVSALIVAG